MTCNPHVIGMQYHFAMAQGVSHIKAAAGASNSSLSKLRDQGYVHDWGQI